MSVSERRWRNILGRSWILVILALGGGVTGAAYASLRPPDYSADAYVIAIAGPGSDSSTALNFAQAYGRVAARQETLAFAHPVFPGLGTPNLLKHLRASTSPDAPLIQLTGAGNSPGAAATYANAGADALIRYGNIHRKETGVRLVLLSGAMPPAEPTAPNPLLDMAVGTATGLLLGGLMQAAAVECRAAGRRRLKQSGRRMESSRQEPEPDWLAGVYQDKAAGRLSSERPQEEHL